METPENFQSIVVPPMKSVPSNLGAAPAVNVAAMPASVMSAPAVPRTLRPNAPTVLPTMVGVAQKQSPQSVSAPLEGVYCLPIVSDLSFQLIVGQRVHQGELLGFIEVMKMRCMVQSPCSGIIQTLLVKPGQKVTLGECLMVVKPIR